MGVVWGSSFTNKIKMASCDGLRLHRQEDSFCHGHLFLYDPSNFSCIPCTPHCSMSLRISPSVQLVVLILDQEWNSPGTHRETKGRRVNGDCTSGYALRQRLLVRCRQFRVFTHQTRSLQIDLVRQCSMVPSRSIRHSSVHAYTTTWIELDQTGSIQSASVTGC